MATTVFRVEKNREYVVMSNKFLREKEMSLKAKGLLALCLSLPDTWNYSLNGLCAICKESQTSIRSALKELEQFHYLKRNRKNDKNGHFIYEYVIYETPYAQNLHMANQHASNVHTDDVHAEDHIQENIDEVSIEEESINEENIEEKDIYNILDENIKDGELKDLYKEYIEMRKSIKHEMTERGLKMLITRCERLSNMNIRVQKLLLENAIINNWKNVYLPKEEEIKVANKPVLDELKNFYGADY